MMLLTSGTGERWMTEEWKDPTEGLGKKGRRCAEWQGRRETDATERVRLRVGCWTVCGQGCVSRRLFLVTQEAEW